MNPTQSAFSSARTGLKLPRRAVAESGQTAAPFAPRDGGEVAAELTALAERESNLREYEARLRAWQERLDAASQGQPVPASTAAPFPRPASAVPFQNDPALSAAWDKLYRARSLMEAEQNQLRDDRMALRDREEQLRRSEAALLEREALVAERERLLTALAAELELSTEVEKPRSALQRLTQAPWAVFKSGK